MEVIIGYDKGINERTLTLFLTESEAKELFDKLVSIRDESNSLLSALDVFMNKEFVSASVDGENGDIMTPRRESDDGEPRATSRARQKGNARC